MNDLAIITALEQAPVSAKLSNGVTYTVRPLTIRRIAKAAALLKDLQGNPKDFNNPEAPEFRTAVCNALMAAGDKMPEALALLTGDEELKKLDDISLIDLGALIVAAARTNNTGGLKDVFRQAKEAFTGKADQEKKQ